MPSNPPRKEGFNYMPRGVYQHKKGYKRPPRSEEWSKNISNSNKGRNVWNKGKKEIRLDVLKKQSESHIGKKQKPETIEKRRLKLLGHKVSKEARKSIGLAHKGNKYCLGIKRTIEQRKRQSERMKGKKMSEEAKRKQSGSNSCHWKGGKTSFNKKLRKSKEFKGWRKQVFERDNYTCWICEEMGGDLHPHHLKELCNYFKLAFDINNGLTLCEFCHKAYTDYGIKCIKINQLYDNATTATNS